MQTLERARPGRRTVDKPQFVGSVTDLIVPDAEGQIRPQAFLVEQMPNWTLPTHFHLQHQFQVFVAGGGSLGKNPVERLAIHYASPHSGYGPLISGDEGISYLTLRVIGDVGAWYLPESREHLKLRIKKQQVHGGPTTQVTPQELQALQAPVEETLIAPDDGGLAAWLVRLPPNRKALAPAHGEKSGGRFYVVTKGALRAGDDELAGLATVFVSRDDTLDIESGEAGLEMLVLQFPEAALLGTS